MVSLENERFIPFGRQFLSVHPITVSSNQNNESWFITYETGDECEQEVYSNGSVVIWSKISNKVEKTISKKCFSLDNEIKQAKLCQFYGLSSLDEFQNYQPDNGHSVINKYISVLQSTSVDVFGLDGTIYTCPLPFKVDKIWPLPNGFCVQREITGTIESHANKTVPTLFSLVHPLDDFSPVVYRYPDSKKSFYFSDNDHHIVFSSTELPLLITFDISIGSHTIWKVRKATTQDKPDPIAKEENSIEMQQKYGNISSRVPSRLSSSFVGQNSSFHANTPSPSLVARSRVHTPVRTNTPPGLIKLNSPASKSNVQTTRLVSPHSAMMHEASTSSDNVFANSSHNRSHGWFPSPMIYRLPSDDHSINDDHEFESMPPSVCFEHIWEEDGKHEQSHNEDNLKWKANYVFLSEDLCGQTFLCFLMKEIETLRLIEIEHRVVTSSYFFGTCSEITAKDAGPLTKLKMMVVLEPTLDVMLYSGNIKICRVNAFVNIENLPPQETSSGLDLLRSSYGVEDPGTKCFSQDSSTHQILLLRDFSGQNFSMVLQNDDIYRVNVPDVTSDELVSSCLDVMIRCYDNDTTIDLIGRYYSAFNESTCQSASQWKIFMDTTLLLMGFPETLRKSMIQDEGSSPAPPLPKKAKKSDSFCENVDWEFMLESECFSEIANLFGSKENFADSTSCFIDEIRLNSTAPLFLLIPKLLEGWHLLYEDLKLNVMSAKQRKELANLLFILSRCLRQDSYKNFYSKDFPGIDKCISKVFYVHKDQLDELSLNMEKHPESIESYLIQEVSLSKISSEFSSPFKTSQLIMKAVHCITSYVSSGITASPDSMISELQISDPCKIKRQVCTERLLDIFSRHDFRKSDLQRLPFALSVVIEELLHNYRHSAPSHLPPSSAILLNREDLAAQSEYSNSGFHSKTERVKNIEDEELFKIRFNCDLRIEEVKRLLDSSTPVNINIGQKPEVSDHDFIKEQEAKLLLLSKRSMALSVGRGMFLLGTHAPLIGETISIPTLDLTGKASQSNKIVTLSSQTDLTADQLQWPLFHNGVSAGLRIIHGSSQIDSTWIVYNKLKYKELNEELSGFMMALGLTGHLNVLPPHLIHDYLAKGREFTSIAILLGFSASKCGSKDAAVYKLLAVHVDALLPSTALEICIPHSAQVAALLGTGLLYMETMERHLIKILLQEISRPPGPEMENSVDRSSHSLAAGFALGMVLLGKGTDSLYLSDLRIAEELHHLAFGGQQCELPTYLREIFKSPSYLIKEGDTLNTDVTCPSAVMALALIFLKTNNRVVANWLRSPDTSATLETIKPDNLLLMLLARGLILWDETLPSIEWVKAQTPMIFDDIDFDVKPSSNYEADQETLRLGYCCVVAGCCMAMGIKFAGSSNKAAFETLMHYTITFKKLSSNPVFEKGGKAIIEMCLATILLSVSVVMAGSGNLQVLRIARSLRQRVNADISYGTYLALHMAIGFLFLGGGRFSLSTSNKAIVGLLCALYPKFPHNSKDNRYHLQAFRHLYILACEPRLVIPRDVDTGSICYVPLQVKLKETSSYPASNIKLLAPCFIPELSFIEEIQIQGPRYWPVTIKPVGRQDSWNDIFKMIGCLFVKKKAGYLPYSDDPKGHRNLMARTFTNQSEKLETISSFSSDLHANLLGEIFCAEDHSRTEEMSSEFLSNVLFECVAEEKLDVLSIYINIERILQQAENGLFDAECLRQLELLFHFYNILHPRLKANAVVGKPLINENYLIQSQLRLENSMMSYHKK